MIHFYLLGLKKIFFWIKKAFIIFSVYFIIISLFFYFFYKDNPGNNEDLLEKKRQEIYKVINDQKYNESEEGRMAIYIYRGVMCRLIGEGCTNNPDDAQKFFPHSLTGFLTNLLTFTYTNPPASGIYWTYNSLQNTGLIPKIYAAEGVGFGAISGFMNIWKVFRDISYMLLVLVLITIGFMIMFRAKINPQTVITVENALPKIVVALLLITFSFPIAGFLIDLMYISIGIIAVFFSRLNEMPEGFKTSKEIVEKVYFSSNISIFFTFTETVDSIFKLAASIFGILPDLVKRFLNLIVILFWPPEKILIALLNHSWQPLKPGLPAITKPGSKFFLETLKKIPFLKERIDQAGEGTPIVGIVGAILFFILDVIFSNLVASIAGIVIIIFLLIFSLFYLFLRIFFTLLYAYIQIILLIFFAPVILAAEMLPGKSTFSSWIKNLIVNLITWPILTVLLLITKLLINQSLSNNPFWQPPFLMGLNSGYISIIISMGILYMIPDLIKTFKELLGVKPLPLGINLGAFTAGAGAIAGGALGGLSQFYTPYQFLFGAEGLFKKIAFNDKDFQNTADKARKAGQSGGGVAGEPV